MKNIIAVASAFTAYAFILLTAIVNGYLSSYVKINIAVAYLFVFLSLILMTFGFKGVINLVASVKYLFVESLQAPLDDFFLIKKSIIYSYIASFVWVFGYVITVLSIEDGSLLQENKLDILIAISYGFLVSELFLRPICYRIEMLKNTEVV